MKKMVMSIEDGEELLKQLDVVKNSIINTQNEINKLKSIKMRITVVEIDETI